MFQKEGEEDAEEGWSKDAALLHASFDVKRFGNAALVLDGCLHTVKERSDHVVKLRGASDLQEDVEEPVPAHQVEGLGQIYEGNVEGLLLFPALLL